MTALVPANGLIFHMNFEETERMTVLSLTALCGSGNCKSVPTC